MMGGNTTMESKCEILRGQIHDLGDVVLFMMNSAFFEYDEEFTRQHDEMKANIMLAYRHLEDARMRLGKVMQQIQGGVSILDRFEPDEPRPETVG